MAEQSTHINYSFEDIQRYLQGRMSAAEMHDVEKAALQDPFLADAIEGYNKANALTAQQHLNEINATLLSGQKKSAIVSFNKKTQWLRIAALVIIIAGAGVISFFVLNNPNQKNEIAQVKEKVVNNSSAAKNKDSGIKQNLPLQPSIQQNNAAGNKPEQKKSLRAQANKKEKNSSALQDKNLQPDEANIITTAASAKPDQQDENVSKSFSQASTSNIKKDSQQQIIQSKTNAINLPTNTFAGKVTDENNQPVAGAVIESSDKKASAISNLNGDFVLQKKDTALNVTTSTVGYESTNASLQAGNNNRIVLKGNSGALSDVVVTGYGTKKTKRVDQSAMPVGGWENFNNYVVSQLNKDSTKENYMSEKDLVEIEFLIDNNGNPYNFKIIKPLDDEKNSKAIDILKSGPRWTNTSKNKKAKVAIAF